MPDGEAGAMRLTIISIIIAFAALILAHRVNLWLIRRGQDMR